MIHVDGVQANLDYMLAVDKEPVVLSFFGRSQQEVRGVGANLSFSSWLRIQHLVTQYRKVDYGRAENPGFDMFYTPITYGKEKFYHALAISKAVNKEYMLTSKDTLADNFYDILMANHELPLLKEWALPIFNHLCDCRLIHRSSSPVFGQFASNSSDLDGLELYKLCFSANDLKECVSGMLKSKEIRITDKPQRKLAFTDMDSYFKVYGHTIVDSLEKLIKPLSPLDGNMEIAALKSKRLFPQQAAQVNALAKHLNRSSYAILNNGMGTGKTLEGASVIEAYFVSKWLRSHPKATLKDCYSDAGNINYRAIIMCPGHLVNKWAEEIGSEIPYSHVTILRDVNQLVDIKARGIKRSGKEFFIISKDFAKLSYQVMPTVKRRTHGPIMRKVCADCGNWYMTPATQCACGSKKYGLQRTDVIASGMTCPHCKAMLIPYKRQTYDDSLTTLDYMDFTNQSSRNERCFYCGETLWQPHVANLGESKGSVWYRATHWTNKAHKGKKTVWVHKKYAEEYFKSIGEQPLNVLDSETHFGVRKISPAFYIKRQLKGFFDFAVFDEAHQYKGAGTAQGNTMHALIKASRKQLALTGTIAGGYASDLFYLLFRLCPWKMKKRGYTWGGVTKFVSNYGHLETLYKFDEQNTRYNTMSHGKAISSPQEKPGISPKIFPDFLLDCAVFLDLADMSKYLPKLNEIVEVVNADSSCEESEESYMMRKYREDIKAMEKLTHSSVGKTILSTMLQYSLAYLDHPYDYGPIKSAIDGSTLVQPYDSEVFKNGALLSKEKRLIEIVNKEIAERRNVVVYAEFTSSANTCVSYRLKQILEDYCNLKGQVTVIESSSPAASEREAWMHKKATEGIKVFITNPKNVETGLDFCFKVDGVAYNYPTLIFYQMGYSLFTIWQASRRAYRLIQKEECRTYYMAVEGTVQQAIISLIAKKMSATSAIQGKFSAEGLTAMAQGVDVKLQLAQALASDDNVSGADLQNMFDVLNADDTSEDKYGKFKKMLLFSELTGMQAAITAAEIPSDDEDVDIFDLFAEFDVAEKPVITEPKSVVFDSTSISLEVVDRTSMTKKESKTVAEGQLSIFGLLS